MAWTHEVLAQTLIPNTTMTVSLLDGVPKTYDITPNEGYVLHDKALDIDDTLGYYSSNRSVGASYDFSHITIIEGYTAYGNREFFARPRTEVPENQIFGGGNNNHEVM